MQPLHDVVLGEPQEEFMMERTESAHSVVKDDFDPRSESRLWDSDSGDDCFPSPSSSLGIIIVLIIAVKDNSLVNCTLSNRIEVRN